MLLAADQYLVVEIITLVIQLIQACFVLTMSHITQPTLEQFFFLKVLLAFLNTFLTRASHTMGHLSQLWPRRLEGVAGLHRKVILLLSKIPAQNPDLGGWGKCLPSNHTILW